MEEASTSTRSSSSCDLRSPLRMRSQPVDHPVQTGRLLAARTNAVMKNYE